LRTAPATIAPFMLALPAMIVRLRSLGGNLSAVVKMSEQSFMAKYRGKLGPDTLDAE
jgi:hypothetical protein